MSVKGKRVLVTGGAGFIGSHVVERCIKEGAKVTVIDNLSRGSLLNIKKSLNNISFFKKDIKKLSSVLPLFKNQDVVINLAALNTGVDYDIGRTELMFEENMLLQMNPLRAASLAGVPFFLQMSSASVYSKHAMEENIPTKEVDDGGEPENSKEGYAYAKRMGEKLAKWYAKNTNMQTVAVRSINVYGIRDHTDEMGHFIPCMIKKILLAKDLVEVFGSGIQKRSFLHVNDLINGFLLLIDKGKNGEVYNIDAQDEHTIKEIVTEIQKIINKPQLKIVFNQNLPEGSKRRILNNQKMQKLGWEPQHDLVHSIPGLIQDIRMRRYEE